jgi:hypothetical protein
MKGPLVEDLVNAQDKRLETCIDPTTIPHVAETDEVLWTEFEATFEAAWKDTTKSANTYDQLMKLVMKDLDIDTYIATFEHLAASAGWEPNAMGTTACFRAGLQENVHHHILNHKNIPTTMDAWKESSRKEVQHIKEIQNAGLTFQRSQCPQGFYQSTQQTCTQQLCQNNGIVPMDVDNTNLIPYKKLTDEECTQYCNEGRCVRCQTQGHMAHNCPKNTNWHTNAPQVCATDTTTTPTITTITPASPTPPKNNLTIAQQICALEDRMTDKERGNYLDARDMGEDFCSAEL